MKNFLTENTQELVKNLISSVTKAELIDFICNCDHAYTKATAENFIEHLKSQKTSESKIDNWRYDEFVLGVIWYGVLYYGYDFEKVARQQLESYKSRKIHQAEEEAKEYRKDARQTNFRCMLIDFYKWRITEEDAKKMILWNHAEDSRWAKNDNQMKTLSKVAAKKQTKSHTLEKVLKVIEEDIARGYGDWANITDEQQKHAQQIEKSHGFVTRW